MHEAVLHTISERDFQAQIIEAAELFGWTVYHVPDSRKVTCRGYPDLTLIRQRDGQTRLLFAELKTQKGRLRPEQRDWLALLASCPVETYTWRPRDWETIVKTLSM